MSTLLYNIVTLFGGIALCYWTSYQLSMLAFVTVGPITYLWDMYGTWSKRLTRRVRIMYTCTKVVLGVRANQAAS